MTPDLADVLVQLALVVGKLGLLTMGSVATILAEMEREVVGHGWMTHTEFVAVFALTQIAPGSPTLMMVPIGYHAAGFAGALVALLAYFVPTMLLALLVSRLWYRVRDSRWPQAIRTAVVPVAVGIILAGVWSLGVATIQQGASLLIFVVAYLALRARMAAPLVMLGAAALGALLLGA